MALYVYITATGALYSWAPNDTDPAADAETLAAQGLTLVTGLPALDDTHGWDVASKSIVTVTPEPKPSPISTGKWILRFTPQEFQAISASTDATVQQFLYALNHTTQLDLTDVDTTNGVAYLVSVNLLQQSRVDAILAVA